jgi:hypothetical protein
MNVEILYTDGIAITERVDDRIHQAIAILTTLNVNPLYDREEDGTMRTLVMAVIDLLQLAKDDNFTLDQELGRFGMALGLANEPASGASIEQPHREHALRGLQLGLAEVSERIRDADTLVNTILGNELEALRTGSASRSGLEAPAS